MHQFDAIYQICGEKCADDTFNPHAIRLIAQIVSHTKAYDKAHTETRAESHARQCTEKHVKASLEIHLRTMGRNTKEERTYNETHNETYRELNQQFFFVFRIPIPVRCEEHHGVDGSKQDIVPMRDGKRKRDERVLGELDRCYYRYFAGDNVPNRPVKSDECS